MKLTTQLRPSQRPQTANGFSLIELLIVVGIIGVITGIAIPNYIAFSDKSILRSTQSDLAALSLALENDYQKKLQYPIYNLADTNAIMDSIGKWKPSSERFRYYIESNANGYTIGAEMPTEQGNLSSCHLSLQDNGTQELSSCDKYAPDGKWI